MTKKHRNANKAFVVKIQASLFGAEAGLIYDKSRKIHEVFNTPSQRWLKKVFKGEFKIYAWVYIDDNGELNLPHDSSSTTTRKNYEKIDFPRAKNAKKIFNLSK